MGHPFVIKPTDRHGGAGYRLIRTRTDFHEGLQGDPAYAHAPLVAQEFIPGKDVDISVLAVAGTIRHASVQTPEGGGLRFVDDEAAVHVAQRLVQQSTYSGVLHLDGRRDERDGRIKLIEANPRVWGSIRASAWCGLDFVEAGIAVARGTPPQQPAVIREGSYPGLRHVVKEIALGRVQYASLTLQQRQLLRLRLIDVRCLIGRASTATDAALRRARGHLAA